jgi:hypothetical protein
MSALPCQNIIPTSGIVFVFVLCPAQAQEAYMFQGFDTELTLYAAMWCDVMCRDLSCSVPGGCEGGCQGGDLGRVAIRPPVGTA